MTKVAIKSDKITSFGGIFHVMDVFSKLRRVNQQVQNYKTYLKNSHFGVEKFNFSLGLSFNFFCIDIIPDEPIFMFLLISNTSEFQNLLFWHSK